jgi:hypothetical protein
MRFYHSIRSGVSFKVNETVIELWHSNSFGTNDSKSSTISFCRDDDDDEEDVNVTSFLNEDIFECDVDENKRIADEGSDENESLLVRYDINSDVSLWKVVK